MRGVNHISGTDGSRYPESAATVDDVTRRTPAAADSAPDPALDQQTVDTPEQDADDDGVDGRTTRWEAHRQARRTELVTATLRAIRRHGAGVGMDDIARTAGTSKTVFYRHFKDRDGLYRAVAESVDAMLTQSVNDAFAAVIRADSAQSDSARSDSAAVAHSAAAQRALLRTAVDTYLQLVQDDPQVYQFIVAAPLVPAKERHLADPAIDVTDVMSGRMAALLMAQLVAIGTEPGRAGVWGRAVVGMVRSVADQWLRSGGSASGTGREELVEDVTDLLWHGLSSSWDAR